MKNKRTTTKTNITSMQHQWNIWLCSSIKELKRERNLNSDKSIESFYAQYFFIKLLIENINIQNETIKYDVHGSTSVAGAGRAGATPNGSEIRTTYDGARRTTEIRNLQNTAVVSEYSYTYDANGNRTEQIESNGGAAETTTYTYDNNDRLLTTAYPDVTTVYTYDNVYNRLTEITTDNGNVETVNKTYRYNNRNQIEQVTDNLNPLNTATYSYDNNGNRISKTVNNVIENFNYDVRDQLKEILSGGSSIGQFLYDYQGLRIRKQTSTDTKRYVYDDQSVLQQTDDLGTTLAKYDYGPDRLLSLNHNTQGVQFYLFDALGSVVNLTTPQGAIQARTQYDAWGNIRNEVGGSENPFGFTGHEMDKESGLIYMKARYYDPETGGMTSEDAFAGTTDTPPSLHKYLYAFGNPLVYVDLDGNCAMALTTQECTELTANIIGVDSFTREGVDAVRDFETGQISGGLDAAGEAITAPMVLAKQMIGAGVEQRAYGTLGYQNTNALKATAEGAVEFIKSPIDTTLQSFGNSSKAMQAALEKGDYSRAGHISGKMGTNATLSLSGLTGAGTSLLNLPKLIQKSKPLVLKEAVNKPSTSFDLSQSVGAARVRGSVVERDVLSLPSAKNISFSIGEKLVSRSIFERLIEGKASFNLTAPSSKSFFFNKAGANKGDTSLRAAKEAGFNLGDIRDVINKGGNELVRIRFKLNNVNQISVPGISKFSDGVGAKPIPGANNLFTGNGKTQSLTFKKGIDEFIGSNVKFNAEDLVGVQFLGPIKLKGK